MMYGERMTVIQEKTQLLSRAVLMLHSLMRQFTG